MLKIFSNSSRVENLNFYKDRILHFPCFCWMFSVLQLSSEIRVQGKSYNEFVTLVTGLHEGVTCFDAPLVARQCEEPWWHLYIVARACDRHITHVGYVFLNCYVRCYGIQDKGDILGPLVGRMHSLMEGG